MKKVSILVLALPLLFFIDTSRGDAPILDEGVYIFDGALPLEVDRHSTPEVVDWNNDGLKDLIVGQFGYGKITLFLNQGTDINPVFNGGSFLKSGSVDLTTSYG